MCSLSRKADRIYADSNVAIHHYSPCVRFDYDDMPVAPTGEGVIIKVPISTKVCGILTGILPTDYDVDRAIWVDREEEGRGGRRREE